MHSLPREGSVRRSWSPSTTATSWTGSNTPPTRDPATALAAAHTDSPGGCVGNRHTNRRRQREQYPADPRMRRHAPPESPAPASFTFTGPVNAATIRKIACDADIIPVVLGSEGRILDIGRTTRIFPPHIRKAITARDQGCAFPGCTIPAPWCEAHHITYWSHGGIHEHQQRNAALLLSPPPHPQGTVADPGQNRCALVHPATPHRPTPKAPTQQILQMLTR